MTWTDEELVARSRSGDMDSFNQLILRWERPIYALAYRTLGREEDARVKFTCIEPRRRITTSWQNAGTSNFGPRRE